MWVYRSYFVLFYVAMQYYIIAWIWHLLPLLTITEGCVRAYMIYIHGTYSLLSIESIIREVVQSCHEVEGFSSLHLVCLGRLSQMIYNTGNKQLFHIFVP